MSVTLLWGTKGLATDIRQEVDTATLISDMLMCRQLYSEILFPLENCYSFFSYLVYEAFNLKMVLGKCSNQQYMKIIYNS